MLKKKSKNSGVSIPPDKFDTLIGEGTKIEGNIVTVHTLRVDGGIEGDVKTEGTIHIGESGKVEGSLKATNVIISGSVQGDIVSKETLRITDTGKLLGNAAMKTLIVDENGVFEGNSKMNQKENVKEYSKRKDFSQVEKK